MCMHAGCFCHSVCASTPLQEPVGVAQKPSVAMTARPPPTMTHKKLANLVAEMMQGIDVRMGRKPKGDVTASAA